MARRYISVGAVLALTLSMGVVTASGAWAASGPAGKTTCTTVTGTSTGTVQISGCLDAKGANTGGGSIPLPTGVLAAGGTVTWLSGKTTTVGTPALAATNAKKCPGYVKPVKGQPAPNNPIAFKTLTAVTSDTAGFKVPGKLKGAVCVSTTGNVTDLKPFKIN